jgi:hypothetical protein
MRFDYKNFHVDCRARHDEDGHYYARARITPALSEDAARADHHDSGDLNAFSNEGDAIECARAWAKEWCDQVWR